MPSFPILWFWALCITAIFLYNTTKVYESTPPQYSLPSSLQHLSCLFYYSTCLYLYRRHIIGLASLPHTTETSLLSTGYCAPSDSIYTLILMHTTSLCAYNCCLPSLGSSSTSLALLNCLTPFLLPFYREQVSKHSYCYW